MRNLGVNLDPVYNIGGRAQEQNFWCPYDPKTSNKSVVDETLWR